MASIVLAAWRLLDRGQRRRLAALQGLSVLMALSTVGGIAAVLPFFTVLADPGAIHRVAPLRFLYERLRFAGDHGFEVALGIAFMLVIVFSNLLNALGTMAMNRFAYQVGDGFQVTLFDEYLHRSYQFHSRTNSATLASNVLYESARVTGGVLQSGLILVTNVVTIVFIIASIVAVNPLVAALAATGLGASYAMTYLVVRGRLLRNGQIETRFYQRRTRIVSEGMGAIKDILVFQAQRLFVEQFAQYCKSISRAIVSTLAISQTPRYVVESATAFTLVGVALYLSGRSAGAGLWIGELSFFGLAAYRLMPALQQAYSATARIRADRSAFLRVADDLRQARDRTGVLAGRAIDRSWHGRPQREIRMTGISFRHGADGPLAIEDLTLTIPARTSVGFIGANGSGKTTLVDLLSGLLVPGSGQVEIDGVVLDEGNRRAWLSTIAYVPQSIYLYESTFAENIALGVPPGEIDLGRLHSVAHLAQLEQCVAELPHGINEPLGEGGVRLSGGQRQRLGIARALYREASVLIMDEATSSLDAAAERDITDLLAAGCKDRTVLLVAHRLNALKHCSVIHELANGRIVRSGTYQQLAAE